MGRRRRRRRRRGGFFRSVSRVFRRRRGRRARKKPTGQGISKPLKNTSTKGNTSGWGASQGDKKGGGFVKVTDKGEINLTVTTPAEMGDKIDIDWDNTDLTKGKMLDVHIHRLAGPIPDPPGKKK